MRYAWQLLAILWITGQVLANDLTLLGVAADTVRPGAAVGVLPSIALREGTDTKLGLTLAVQPLLERPSATLGIELRGTAESLGYVVRATISVRTLDGKVQTRTLAPEVGFRLVIAAPPDSAVHATVLCVLPPASLWQSVMRTNRVEIRLSATAPNLRIAAHPGARIVVRHHPGDPYARLLSLEVGPGARQPALIELITEPYGYKTLDLASPAHIAARGSNTPHVTHATVRQWYLDGTWSQLEWEAPVPGRRHKPDQQGGL